MEIICGKDICGKTVKGLLAELKISAKTVTALKKKPDGITVDGEHVTVRHILREGEILRLNISDEQSSQNVVPADLPIEILFEDDSAVAVNKPPFMPTHPSHGHYDDTLANALCYRMQRDGEPFVFRPVNRLDRNTSGVVLVAKNRVSAASLSESLQKGDVGKKYLAILEGIPAEQSGKIETYVRRREESIIYREVCPESPDADLALTEYEVIEVSNGYSLVCASPITGRTHQLRLHFSHVGCPILGDDLYGHESDVIARQALHAYSLTFPLPASGKEICVRAPLPDDFKEALLKLGFKYEQ